MLQVVIMEDEDEAAQREKDDENEEVLLTANAGYTWGPHVPPEEREQIIERLQTDLEDTTEDHVEEAVKSGFSDFTLASLKAVRYRIGGLGPEELELVLYATLAKATLQLAMGLELGGDNADA